MKTTAFFAICLLLFGLFLASSAESCSTFMISRDGCLIVAHNLDQEFYTPGMIHVNRRGEIKRSVSCFDLQLTDTETPILQWTSKYGSITFSLLGRNLPDGGMNEAGLTVSEMGLGESSFSFNDTLPTMLSHQWIQYQLDSYATVAEVLAHLPDVNIEPQSTFSPPASANYHLFVTDSAGNFAIVEFLDGGPVVYKDDTAPIPALCNRPYERELKILNDYRGFFGWIKRKLNPGHDPRFVNCALALEEYQSVEDGDPVEFAFNLLTQMQFESTKQWSVVYDILKRRVYFRTAIGANTRHFDLDSFDFSSDAPALVYEDIDVDLAGGVSEHFVEFTPEADRVTIDRFLRSLIGFCAKTDDSDRMEDYLSREYGFDLESYVDRALKITELIRHNKETPPGP